MSVEVAMEDEQNVRVQYKPNDYNLFRAILFLNLNDTKINQIATLFEFEDGLMNAGQNKGGGDQSKMVDLLEEKGHISKDSIEDIVKFLRDLSLQGTSKKIEELYKTSRKDSDLWYGSFTVALASQFTNDMMYGLAILLNFQPAEMENLGLIPEGNGKKLILLLEQKDIINENDVSKLFKALDNEHMTHFTALLTKLKEMTTPTEYPDLC